MARQGHWLDIEMADAAAELMPQVETAETSSLANSLSLSLEASREPAAPDERADPMGSLVRSSSQRPFGRFDG